MARLSRLVDPAPAHGSPEEGRVEDQGLPLRPIRVGQPLPGSEYTNAETRNRDFAADENSSRAHGDGAGPRPGLPHAREERVRSGTYCSQPRGRRSSTCSRSTTLQAAVLPRELEKSSADTPLRNIPGLQHHRRAQRAGRGELQPGDRRHLVGDVRLLPPDRRVGTLRESPLLSPSFWPFRLSPLPILNHRKTIAQSWTIPF